MTPAAEPRYVRVHDADNVAIIVNVGGLRLAPSSLRDSY